MIERFNITKYYLVGEVVGGSFGKHHHDEFFDIISQKEKLAFLDQVVVNEQERKAKKRAAREGMWETVGTVVAVVGLSILTGGIAGGLAAHGLAAMGLGGGAILGIAGAAVGGYVAYQGHKGYQMGGEKGAALAMGSSALAMFSGSPVSFGGSYSYEQGFGVNIGYSFGGSGNSSLGNVGLGYSEKGGFGLSGGINITPSIGINANIHQSGAWGVGASYNQLNNAGQKQGMAMNVGYRETADGKVGLTGGVSYYNTSGDQSTYGIGANYDSLFGWGASISHSGTSNNGGPIKSFNGQASWNQNSGFQSQLDMKFDRVKMLELLGESWDYLTDVAQGFTDSMMNAWDDVVNGVGYVMGLRESEDTQREIQKVVAIEGIKKIKEKLDSGQPLTMQDQDDLDRFNSILGISSQQINVIGKRDGIRIYLDEEERQDFLKSHKSKIVDALRGAIDEESESWREVKVALDEFEKNPNPETTAKLIAAYDNTGASIGIGFIPIAGQVGDALIAYKDAYEGNYVMSGIGVAATMIPMLPGKLAKKIFKIGADKVDNLGVVGKNVDEVAERLIPLGFKDAEQYNKAMTELNSILKKLDVNDAKLGISGSSVSGYSYKTGKPFNSSSDIDVFIESNILTNGLATSKNIPGFVHPNKLMNTHLELSMWSERWTKELGREVSIGGFHKGTLPRRPTIFYGE
jgi:hypothetical protein